MNFERMHEEKIMDFFFSNFRCAPIAHSAVLCAWKRVENERRICFNNSAIITLGNAFSIHMLISGSHWRCSFSRSLSSCVFFSRLKTTLLHCIWLSRSHKHMHAFAFASIALRGRNVQPLFSWWCANAHFTFPLRVRGSLFAASSISTSSRNRCLFRPPKMVCIQRNKKKCRTCLLFYIFGLNFTIWPMDLSVRANNNVISAFAPTVVCIHAHFSNSPSYRIEY